MTDLSRLSVSKRLTIVEHIGDPSDGDSLAGQNVNGFPAGSLFYVRASNRFYQLRKNLDPAVVATSRFNVVDGIGSSATAGRFVAVQQSAFAAFTTPGSVAVSGFDLTSDGHFLVSYVIAGGTQGFLSAETTAPDTVTVTSSSGSDTSSLLIVFVENPEDI